MAEKLQLFPKGERLLPSASLGPFETLGTATLRNTQPPLPEKEMSLTPTYPLFLYLCCK